MSMKTIFENGESIEFAGKVVVALAQEPNIMKYTAKVIVAADYAQQKSIKDIDGRVIPSYRQLNSLLASFILPGNLKFLANFIPNFVKIPQFVLDIMNSKF